jgi:hypothetical protein
MAKDRWNKSTMAAATKISEGVLRIANERLRHFEEEGWDADHDAQHVNNELSLVACCYAAPRFIYIMEHAGNEIYFADPWPETWNPKYDKRNKHDRLRRLEIAGALIAAEIDRIISAEKCSRKEDENGGTTQCHSPK